MGAAFPYLGVACGEPRAVWRKSAPLNFKSLLIIGTMDIKYKIKLVEVLRLRPADLGYINVVNLSSDCLEALMQNNSELLEKELAEIASDENVDEKVRVIAASLKTQLLWMASSDALDKACAEMTDDGQEDFEGDFPVEETWESKLYREKQGNSKEREKAFKEGKRLVADLTKEELVKRYCEFILQKYPQLKDGFDNGLYRIGMNDFHEHIGIHGKEYLLPQKDNTKVYMARREVMPELNRMIDEIFIKELDFWKSEYKKWLELRHETRISKKSIKLFFEEKGKHASENVLDKMKMGCSYK